MTPEPTFAGQVSLSASELREAWTLLSAADRVEGFGLLSREQAEEFFQALSSFDQAELLLNLPTAERRLWFRFLAPDDAADVLQEVPAEERSGFLSLLDERARADIVALLAYEEDAAGGLMSPLYARVRPEMTVDEAIAYLRKQARQHLETLYYAYALDPAQRLQGVVSARQLFATAGDRRISEIMRREVVSVPEDMDQEQVARLIARLDLMAIPVVDGEGRMKGIVTVDDIVDVFQEEATEDIQKLGGMEALDTPYLDTGFFAMVRKRGGWLAALFIGEMLTTSAMTHFENAMQQAVVLAVFVPLIISSGGNSGSQASSLLIRALALREVRFRDWWRVTGRELLTGMGVGVLLGVIGFLRITGWHVLFGSYGEHYLLVALAVAVSLVGVVTFGTLCGSMLPFVLQRLGFDPASASAPFVATLVDVTGVLIYFTAATLILSGSLLP